jgi:hypothetical protein
MVPSFAESVLVINGPRSPVPAKGGQQICKAAANLLQPPLRGSARDGRPSQAGAV